MSALTELLYRLRPGELDEPMQWLVPHFTQDQVSAAQLSVGAPNLGRRIPEHQALLLDTWCIDATPGVGQFVVSLTLELVNTTVLQQIVLAQDRTPGAVNAFKTLQATGAGLLIPAGSIILARAVFNAAGVANVVTLNLAGVRVPLGNINRQ